MKSKAIAVTRLTILFPTIIICTSLIMYLATSPILGRGLWQSTLWITVAQMLLLEYEIGLFTKVKKDEIPLFPTNQADKQRVLLMSLVGIALMLAGNIIMSLIGSLLHVGDVSNLSEAKTTFEIVSLGVTSVLIAPIVEELTFRYGLREIMGKFKIGEHENKVYIVTSAVIFMLAHLPEFTPAGAIASASIFLSGLVLASVYVKTEKLITPIAAHMVYNALIFTLFLMKL